MGAVDMSGTGGAYEKVALLPSANSPLTDVEATALLRRNAKLQRALFVVAIFAAVLSILSSFQTWPSASCPGSESVYQPRAIDQSTPLFDSALFAEYGGVASKIVKEAEKSAVALHERLKALCFLHGPRLSGTTGLVKAIKWAEAQMSAFGLENVHLQEVQGISSWTRGEESLFMLTPVPTRLVAVAIGGSDGGDVSGEVISVSTFEELTERAAEAKGKIVLFNAIFTEYSETVVYRTGGASAAAKVGAIAALVRSISSWSMGNPHTGALHYEDGVPRIPIMAVSLEHSDFINWHLKAGTTVAVHLKTGGSFGPPAVGHNVIGQITGSKFPNEVVTVGGHIDSWDIGLGAMDDGAGFLSCLEAVRLLHTLGLRPKRTVRVVAFVNEEQGGGYSVLGGDIYASGHSKEKHVLAIESDSGAFSPEGYVYHGGAPAYDMISKIAKTLLQPLNATQVNNADFSGTDIEPLFEAYGTPVMELLTANSKYFWYHHSVADTPDKMDPQEMGRCAATMAITAYVVADMDEAASLEGQRKP
eukprot:TRINITY_DN251_c0_g1_i1.p1 TRINITY_DN251_c0_g1~~TRINITY_DN251_c0_g1_i1.p1  ORF type:complete len:532 (-),score=111.63 TRINITY_DN251_c0_g1_i1:701-2296(-)